jgi:hypothetical protein
MFYVHREVARRLGAVMQPNAKKARPMCRKKGKEGAKESSLVDTVDSSDDDVMILGSLTPELPGPESPCAESHVCRRSAHICVLSSVWGARSFRLRAARG